MLRVDHSLAIARTDTAIAHLDGNVIPMFFSQLLVLDTKKHGTAMTDTGLGNLGHRVIVEALDNRVWRYGVRGSDLRGG
jgi:hypothetical protein